MHCQDQLELLHPPSRYALHSKALRHCKRSSSIAMLIMPLLDRLQQYHASTVTIADLSQSNTQSRGCTYSLNAWQCRSHALLQQSTSTCDDPLQGSAQNRGCVCSLSGQQHRAYPDLHQGVHIAVGHTILQASKAGAVVEAEVKLISPSQAGLPLYMHSLQAVAAGQPGGPPGTPLPGATPPVRL